MLVRHYSCDQLNLYEVDSFKIQVFSCKTPDEVISVKKKSDDHLISEVKIRDIDTTFAGLFKLPGDDKPRKINIEDSFSVDGELLYDGEPFFLR